MTPSEVNRQVARMTGESVTTISEMGFGLADPVSVSFDPEPDRRPPLVVDWDRLEEQRYAVLPR